ncbi:MAG: hypothetical protein JO209_10385 [Acidisphaera sp.]|nr:hypothetical protein [Acidisphaera sp.]
MRILIGLRVAGLLLVAAAWTTQSAAPGSAAAPETLASAAPAEGFALNTGLTLVTLAGRATAADMLDTLTPGRAVFLVLSDLHAAAPSGVTYELYLDVPAGAVPRRSWAGHVGTLDVFAGARSGGAVRQGRVSYDVTNALERLRARRVLAQAVTLTIVPEQPPAAGAQAVIGRVDLVMQ